MKRKDYKIAINHFNKSVESECLNNNNKLLARKHIDECNMNLGIQFIPIDPDNINNEEIYYSNADFKNTDNVVVLDKEEINFQMDDLYLNDSVNYNKILIKEEEQKEEQKENKFFELKYRKYITSQYL